MISPELYEKYALPFEKKIVDVAHKAGLPYTLHICGNTDAILHLILKTGTDAIELDYKTDINKIFDLYHDKVVLIGNIDPSGILAFGSHKDVTDKTLELLVTYGHSNKFILNAGCAIPAETPSGNLKAMIDIARGF
jgi:uroporphyrinogen decarboxylase